MCLKVKRCKTEIFTCRRILFGIVTIGFISNAILKTIFNITIVAMIKKDNETDSTDIFEWSESQKQNILGIFFWGFALTKIPSGRLAEMFGSKKVSGHSMILAGILSLLTPSIVRWNYYLLLVSRVLMGFLIGASWPAIMPMITNWIPPTEQSVFLSCIISTSIGYALSSVLGGFLISTYGWPSVFYFSGALAFLWSLLWFSLIYDSPQEHPRISAEERKEIESKIGKHMMNKSEIKFIEIPWRSILTSGPVWAITVAQIASFLGNMTIATELPSYLDQVLHYNIKENGLLSALPNCGVYAASLTFGSMADRLLRSGKVSVTTVRKMFGTAGLIVPSFFTLGLSFWGNEPIPALAFFCLTLLSNAAITAGHCTNILDVAPNYSGTICGLVNMLSSFAVYFATKLIAMLLKDGHGFEEWQPFFWTLTATFGLGGIFYYFFCSGKTQSWNSNTNKKQEILDEELPIDVKIDADK